MTAHDRRAAVAAKYATIIGRNQYSQALRDYCYRKYDDGNYYSDCSSSICYTYREAGESWGITNTAGMYTSSRLDTVDVPISDGVPAADCLRPGDMLLYAGNDASRPKRIGHVEMVYSVDGDKVILCGHGSGRPSYKDMAAYCRSRYNTLAPGGWRKGLVCVRRYILDDAEPVQPAYIPGWHHEEDGWRYYLGTDGFFVRNAWYQDTNGKWYWFDASGRMVHDTWYWYKDHWYYLGGDGAMCTGRLTLDGKWYVLDDEGRMITEPVTLTPDKDGALRYPGLGE